MFQVETLSEDFQSLHNKAKGFWTFLDIHTYTMTVEHAPNGGDSDTLTGYVYCPPDWDEARLVTPGPELSRLQYVLYICPYTLSNACYGRQIAIESCTDIGYIRSRNTLEILGDSSADVLQA